MHRFTAILAIVSAVVGLYGCNDKSDGGGKSDELLLHCGAGLRPPVAECAKAFQHEHGVEIITNYAGSEVLLARLKASRRGDLYLPGDRHYVDQAEQAGLVLSRREVCYFVPTIFVGKGNPKDISRLEDLADKDIKLGLGNAEACAIGRKSRKIFKKNDIPWSRVQQNLSFQSMTVNELGMQIQAEALDAVIVWDAVADYYAEHGRKVAIPPAKNIISTVDVGVLKFTENRDIAEKFAVFVASPRGKEIFKKHNYTVEPP